MQISKFYTFYDFTSHNGCPPFKPLVQNRLKRRMEWLTKLHSNWDRSRWVNYFIKILKDDSQSEFEKRFAHWHLLAYMDLDRCYFIWRDFHKLPFYTDSFCELYDLSNSLLFQREKFQKYIHKYDSKNSSGANIKTYILAILRNTIREKLDLKSSWRVLCDVDTDSHRKFDRALQKRRDALESYGITEPYTSQYIFVLKYFISVYKTNRVLNPSRKEGSRWPDPEWSDFIEVANYYNSHRFLSDAPLQTSAGSDVTPETVSKWIHICLKALQFSSRVVEISYNVNNKEQKSNESSNPWKHLDFDEKQADVLERADSILREKIHTIEHSLKEIPSKIPQQFRQGIMPLCYSHPLAPLNQKKLGTKIGVHQGTVSRYIAKYFEIPLLDKFKQFTAENLNPDSYSIAFLETRFTNPKFSNLLDRIIVEAINKLDNKSQIVLKLFYSQHLDVAKIARILGEKNSIEPNEINSILVRARNDLKIELHKELNKWQTEYVKLWIENYYQDIIQTILISSFKKFNYAVREILRMKYCQKIDEQRIIDFYPNLNVFQAINDAKQQLYDSLLRWSIESYGISLANEHREVMKIVKDWLAKNLIYIEL